MNHAIVLVSAFALLGTASNVRADWIADAEAGILHDSNVSRAQFASDVKSDSAVFASLSAGQLVQLGDRASLAITGDLQNQQYQRYHGLSNTTLGLTLAVKNKFGLGAEAPWLRASASATRLIYEHNLRNGWLYAFGFGGGKTLDERWAIRADYRHEHRTGDLDRAIVPGKSGSVFDLHNQSLSLAGDFSYSPATLFSLSYARRVGDVESTTQRNPGIFAVTTALAPDLVFGSGGVAYKLDATTHTLEFGLSHALNPRSSLNVSLQRNAIYGAGNINYYSSIVRATILYNF